MTTPYPPDMPSDAARVPVPPYVPERPRFYIKLSPPLATRALLVVNLIAAVLKFGDRTHIGAIHLASSLVALLQLAAATVVWVVAAERGAALSPAAIAGVVSLAAGALFANVVSVVIMVVETTMQRR